MKIKRTPWREFVYGLIAAEISTLSRYYDRVIQLMPREVDDGLLLEHVENNSKAVASSMEELPDMRSEKEL